MTPNGPKLSDPAHESAWLGASGRIMPNVIPSFFVNEAIVNGSDAPKYPVRMQCLENVDHVVRLERKAPDSARFVLRALKFRSECF